MARTKGYSATAKSLHWLIVVLLAAQFTVAWLMPHIGRNTPVTTLISLHFSFGVIILLIAIIRLAWRATHAEPAPLDGVPPWQVQSARIITGCSICCFLSCRYWDGSTLHGAACRL
jgi:cytochrome b561